MMHSGTPSLVRCPLQSIPAKSDKPARVIMKKKSRNAASVDVIREPLAQNLAHGWFLLGTSMGKGWFGEVRLVRLPRVGLMRREGGKITKLRQVAVKESRMGNVELDKIALNEYTNHREFYKCLPTAGRLLFTYPFEMEHPCQRELVEADRFDRLTLPPLLIDADSDDDSVYDSGDGGEEPRFEVNCFNLINNKSYTVQTWGCFPNETTRSLLHAYETLTPDMLAVVGKDVGAAIWYLHHCKYTHNDLARRNILVCSRSEEDRVSQRALLVDFGLSARMPDDFTPNEASFWNEVQPCIDEIHGRFVLGSQLTGTSPFINAAHEAYLVKLKSESGGS